ncbi:MAG: hypothetical protein H6686_04055 [Fibrobacteria bacterium]|nr:hypothetical protein [Fibrobacteria bacterium]
MSLLTSLDRLSRPLGVRLEGTRARSLREQARIGIARLLMDPPRGEAPGASGIVFSRDRALQLDAFLGSWFSNVLSPCPLRILWTASDHRHERSYAQLQERWKDRVSFHEERDFRSDLLSLLALDEAPRILFFTDDGMFLDPFDLDEAVCWNPSTHIFALTKGRGLRHCFVTDQDQTLPPFLPGPAGAEELLCWTWQDGDPGDWSYPLSVDGHVLGRHEMRILLASIPFRSPNTLEAAMQVFAPYFLLRSGLCFPRERLVNIPANSVQKDWTNRTTGQHDSASLLEHWNAGERIEYEAFRGLTCLEAERTPYRFLRR